MEHSLSLENVGSHGTRTYRTDSSAKEAVLVVVPSELVGVEKSEPPSPFDSGTEYDLRGSYYHTGKNVVAQFPRWSNGYRGITYKAPLLDVAVSETGITGIYQKSDGEAFCVTWNVLDDSWDTEYIEVDDFGSLAHTMGDILWSSVRSREKTPVL